MADLEEDTGKPRQVIFYKAGMKDDVYAILKSVAIHEDLTVCCICVCATSILFLQRFFGLVRSFGGDEDHPTVTKFSQLFRLLSLYTPVKVAVKGNCESGSDRVLLSAFESLGEKRREALVRKSAMKDKVWQQLMSIPFHALSSDADDHEYNAPSPEATALYYLAGYVAFKLKKTTRCEVCKEDALGRRDSLSKEAILVIEREYVCGSLAYPSEKLLACVSTVERTIKHASKGTCFGDLFWDVLDALVKRGTNIVGCSEHANQLTAQTIHFYLTTRMHFFARAKCLENSSAVRAQRERKKAKLV
nr:uncharacterized protein LOC119179289 [Rhipicephalus microplus]